MYENANCVYVSSILPSCLCLKSVHVDILTHTHYIIYLYTKSVSPVASIWRFLQLQINLKAYIMIHFTFLFVHVTILIFMSHSSD